MSSILVLGGTGYIGSHTVYELIAAGENVVVVDNLETGFRKAVHPDAKFYLGGHPIPAKEETRRAGDPSTLIVSSTKAKEILGWNPKFDDLETIITTAWKWHRNHPNGYEA